jgi:hypothetical protein
MSQKIKMKYFLSAFETCCQWFGNLPIMGEGKGEGDHRNHRQQLIPPALCNLRALLLAPQRPAACGLAICQAASQSDTGRFKSKKVKKEKTHHNNLPHTAGFYKPDTFLRSS